MFHRTACAFALSLVLAACSGGGADADNDGEITADEVAREAATGADVTMQPGQWEQTVSFSEVEMPGVPEQMKQMMSKNMTASVKSDNCLGPDDVRKPDPKFFGGADANGNCTYDEFDRSGAHMKIKMTCTAQGGHKSTMAMEGDFGATAYAFDVSTTMEGGPQGPMTMKGRVAGKRTGECPA